MRCVVCTIAAASLVFGVISSLATAQQGAPKPQAIPANPAGNPDQELGRRFLIKAENLPRQKAILSRQVDLCSYHTQDKRHG
jgi:hypothetical protein